MYFKRHQCIWMHLDVFIVYFIVFVVHFNVFQCIYSIFQHIWKYLSIFECTWMHLRCIPMCLNVFNLLYIYFFTIHNDSLPNMLCNYLLFIYSYWSVPTFIHENLAYQLLLSTSIHHPTFHVVIDCAKHSKVKYIKHMYFCYLRNFTLIGHFMVVVPNYDK